ncbi:hypothetical protein G9A89_013727 [Geosiphon pyriformis]|nr:hypothetical protein G9A89_013727 [Geosiphon pyriformis]
MSIYDSYKQLGEKKNTHRCCLETSSTPEEIKTIKNNLSESIELDWDPKPVINFLDSEQFYEHYQELAPIREEQEQCLEQLNT